MAHDVSATVGALRDMFPSLPEEVLLAALEAHGNEVESAIGVLLEMSADAVYAAGPGDAVKLTPATATAPPPLLTEPQKSTPGAAASRAPGATRSKAATGGAPRKTWGQLRAEQQLASAMAPQHAQGLVKDRGTPTTALRQQQPAAAVGAPITFPPAAHATLTTPKYVALGGAGPGARLADSDFPDLAPAGAVGVLGGASSAPRNRGANPADALAALPAQESHPQLQGGMAALRGDVPGVRHPGTAGAGGGLGSPAGPHVSDGGGHGGSSGGGRGGGSGRRRPAKAGSAACGSPLHTAVQARPLMASASAGSLATLEGAVDALQNHQAVTLTGQERVRGHGRKAGRRQAPPEARWEGAHDSPPTASQQQQRQQQRQWGGFGLGGYAQVARQAPPQRSARDGAGGWPGLPSGWGPESDLHVWSEGAGALGDSGGAGWQAAALEQLCRSHGWAGRELVEAVCEALQYDLSEVVSALDELQAASYQDHHRAGASGSVSPSVPASTSRSSPWCSPSEPDSASPSGTPASSSDEDDAVVVEEQDRAQGRRRGAAGRKGSAARGCGGGGRGSGSVGPLHRDPWVADGEDAAYDFDFAVEAGVHRRKGRGAGGAGGAGWRADRAGADGGWRGGGSMDARQAGGRSAEEASACDDAYSRHRRTALKLTHAWRKRMNKASAAFSAGDRALGRQLVAEAQALRQQAAEAHREAAARIEAEMNDGRQLSEWELDLHGLHGEEAVLALARRITALESGAPTTTATTTAATTGSGAPVTPPRRPGDGTRPAPNFKPGAAHAAPHGQHPPAGNGTTSPPPAGNIGACRGPSSRPADRCQLLASRRVLRVIVGKGLHSSGGEASLPRVVAGYLVQHGYRFTSLAGVVEVQLRRKFAASASAGVGAGARGTQLQPC